MLDAPAAAARCAAIEASVAKPWIAQALLQLTNQAALRRLLGVARSNDVAFDIADRIAALIPDAAVAVVGRWTIEVETCLGDSVDLDLFAKTLAAAAAEPFDLDGEHHTLELAIGVAAGPPGSIDEIRLAEEVEDALAQSRNDHAPGGARPVAGRSDGRRDGAEARSVGRGRSRRDCSCNISPR